MLKFVRVAATLVLAAGLITSGCDSDDSPGTPAQREPIRYGLTQQSMSALGIVACDANFFSREGLDAEITEYVSGKRALQALLDGEVDAITTAGIPIVFASLTRRDFRIVAGLASLTTNVERIVARKDRGIVTPADLQGRKVATQRGSAVHFFLHMFLVKYGLTERDIDLTFMKAEELPGALIRGEIDAFSMREPYVGRATKALGNDAIVFEAPGVYYRTDYLVVSEELIRTRPEAVEKMIRALVRAEQFAKQDPSRLVSVVAARLGAENESVVRRELAQTRLDVGLGQSLLTCLENGANWAIATGLTEQTDVPNYLEFIYLDAIESVKPEAVTIIR